MSVVKYKNLLMRLVDKAKGYGWFGVVIAVVVLALLYQLIGLFASEEFGTQQQQKQRKQDTLKYKPYTGQETEDEQGFPLTAKEKKLGGEIKEGEVFPPIKEGNK